MTEVLVTGGSGYIGSHISKMLCEHGYLPIVADLAAHQRPWASPTWPSYNINIGDKDQLEVVFQNHNIQAVIHLAANSEVGPSVWNPLQYYENNIGSTINLIRVCLRNKVKKLVFSSTSAVYGEVDINTLPTQEYYSKKPMTSYGASKLAVEYVLRDVSIAHQFQSVALRYFNASGAYPDGSIGEFRLEPTHLIPSIQAVVEGKRKEFVINGDDYQTPDGTCIRDYAHVWDIANAHISALKYLENDGITDFFNIGGGEGKSVKEVLREFESQIGYEIPKRVGERRSGDIPANFASIDKARAILNWSPKMSDVKSIVSDALKWYNSDLYKLLRSNVDCKNTI